MPSGRSSTALMRRDATGRVCRRETGRSTDGDARLVQRPAHHEAELGDQAVARLVLLEVGARAGVEGALTAVLRRGAAQDDDARPRREADDVRRGTGTV